MSDRKIRIKTFTHLLTCAPTGRGKGIFALIPNLLRYRGNCVTTDPKGELFRISAEYRSRWFGHQILRLDPFALGGPGADSFNPLLFIDPESDDFLDQCRDLANMLVIRTGQEKEPHWNDSAEIILTAFIAYVCACEKEPAARTLSLVRDLVSSRHSFTRVVGLMQAIVSHGGVIQRLGHMLTWFQDKELGSVLTTVQRHTQFLDSPAIARNTASSSFDPRLLRYGKADIYLILPHDRLVTMAPLMRMWIGSIIRIITRGIPDERNPVLFFIDEAGHLGKMQVLEDAVTLMRGMGIRLWFFFQSITQLHICFGEKASTIIDNIDTQQYFGTNSFFAADEISKRIGEATIPVTTSGQNDGTSHSSGSTGPPSSSYSVGRNVSTSNTGRRLLKPEEILALPDNVALIFHKNIPVIPARLIAYFNDPEFCTQPGTGRKMARRPLGPTDLALRYVAVWVSSMTLIAFIYAALHRPKPAPVPPVGSSRSEVSSSAP